MSELNVCPSFFRNESTEYSYKTKPSALRTIGCRLQGARGWGSMGMEVGDDGWGNDCYSYSYMPHTSSASLYIQKRTVDTDGRGARAICWRLKWGWSGEGTAMFQIDPFNYLYKF